MRRSFEISFIRDNESWALTSICGPSAGKVRIDFLLYTSDL